ncbi:MAG: single-stranded DNA-binding protein [Coprobacillus sp.]|nr:single-stranded DNA-binding protein [Coprobacillus sp.]
MINRIVLVGRLTKDPELRKANSGNNVCNFTIAVDDRGRDQDGNKTTSFIPVVCFNKTADSTFNFTKKGSLVGVEGRLVQRKFTRNDGTTTTTFEVNADSVQFLDPKGTVPSEGETVTFDDTPSESTDSSSSLDTLDLADDDLPF